MHYSLAEEALAAFAERHGIPVVETVAGKSTLTHDDPCYAGPIGVIGAEGANRLAAEADVVLAVGTRLGDFATGSWSVFQNPDVRFVGVNAARFDAHKHRSLPVVGDAREALAELDAGLGRLAGAGGMDGADRRRGGHVVGLPRSPRRAARRAADVRPGRRAPICDRATEHDYALDGVGRVPRRAQQRMAVARRRRRSTASTGSRAWATSCPAAGARRWRGRRSRPMATPSCSSATGRT